MPSRRSDLFPCTPVHRLVLSRRGLFKRRTCCFRRQRFRRSRRDQSVKTFTKIFDAGGTEFR